MGLAGEREEEKEGRGEKGERSRENLLKKEDLALLTIGQEEKMCVIESCSLLQKKQGAT